MAKKIYDDGRFTIKRISFPYANYKVKDKQKQFKFKVTAWSNHTYDLWFNNKKDYGWQKQNYYTCSLDSGFIGVMEKFIRDEVE